MRHNKLIVGIGLLLIGVFALCSFATAQEYVRVGVINLEFSPEKVAVDKDGTVYVTDGVSKIYRIIGAGNATEWKTNLRNPYGIAVDTPDELNFYNVYVAENSTGNITSRIQKFSSEGTYIGETLAYGSWRPYDIAIYEEDSDVYIYVADRSNQFIWKYGVQSVLLQWGGYGSDAGKFISPSGIAVASNGDFYVADRDNNRIQKFDISTNTWTTWRGPTASSDPGYFDSPEGITVGPDGNVFVADTGNNRIQKLDGAGNFITEWGSLDTGDGYFNSPSGIAVDSEGTVYVADRGNDRIQKFAPCGLNIAPEVGEITAPMEPIPVGTTIAASATFTDDSDTHTAVWDWGDGDTCVIDEGDGSIIPAGCGTIGQGDTVTGNHTYTTAGVYALTLTVTDGCGGSDDTSFQYVVVYDPDGGFVTGGGWVDSPLGAYADDPGLTGKASFGFVSKYKNGATIPTGQTQFNFKAGDLIFHADSYEWLVVDSDSLKAQYKGSGTINGDGNYDFKVTVDAAEDLFRIKIWDGDNVVYDIQMGEENDYADPTTAISGGSIVIHE